MIRYALWPTLSVDTNATHSIIFSEKTSKLVFPVSLAGHKCSTQMQHTTQNMVMCRMQAREILGPTHENRHYWPISCACKAISRVGMIDMFDILIK